MRKNEHPGCSCSHCRRGSVRRSFTLRATNRKIRHLTEQQLKTATEFVSVVVSVPYTD